MFTDMPSSHSASAHVNGAQFVSWFRTQGWELKLLPPLPWASAWRLASTKGFARLMWYGLLPIQRFYEICFLVGGAKIVVVHKCVTTMKKKPVLESLLRLLHSSVIFNFDDAVYEKGIPYVPERISLADAVWVGNPILADYSKQYCRDVRVIESAVDCAKFAQKPSYDIHDPLRLIWSGSPSSHQYLEKLRAPLKVLAKRRKIRLQIISGLKYSFSDPEIHDEWIPYDPAAEVASLQESDVALMPLADGPYERAKENYKVKMYMACGLPLVCSPVGINKHFIQDGERGFFAVTAEDWVQKIELLAGSDALRRRLGDAARKYAVEKYDVPVIGRQLLNLFEDVSSMKGGLKNN